MLPQRRSPSLSLPLNTLARSELSCFEHAVSLLDSLLEARELSFLVPVFSFSTTYPLHADYLFT